MSKSNTKKKSNKKKASKLTEKAETKKKIEELLIAKGDEIEKAAEELAPDFDYEKESAELLAEELEEAATKKKIEELLVARGEELERAAEELDPEFAAETEEQAQLEKTVEEPSVELETEPTTEAEPATELESEPAAELESEPATEAESVEKPLPPAELSPSNYPKDKYIPKTAIGRLFLKDKNSMVMGAVLAMLLTVIIWQSLDYYIMETVHINYSTLDGVKTEDVSTRAKTVGELKAELIEKGYEIAESDVISLKEEHPIENNMEVSIFKAHKSKAKIAGTLTDIWLINGSVEDNLKFNEIAYDDDDEIKPALDAQVNEDTKIVFNEIHYVKEKKREKVEAVDRVILDPKLTSGVQEQTEGHDGEGYFKYTYKYVNGKKVKTDKSVVKWINKPEDNMLRLGTSLTGQSGDYVVSRTFTANCTAYTARPGAGGALGEGVHYGTCAVDPSFVSYRSQMWIEGYGYAYANDCGGAVKGNIVDLFMNSTSACIKWGRRNCTAYVLTPVE